MNETLKAILSASASFTAVNLDNIFLLMMLFSGIDTTLRKYHIVIGQYIGITVLMVLSLGGSYSTNHFFKHLIIALGIVPIYMGFKSIFQYRKKKESDSPENKEMLDNNIFPSNKYIRFLLNQNSLKIAAIAIANGDDDIGVYISLFSNSSFYQIIVILVVFAILVGVMCYISYKLIKHPFISKGVQKYGHIITPYFLIALGVYILLGGFF